MLPILAKQLGTSEWQEYRQWIDRVRCFRGSEKANPAIRCVDFLDHEFVRMSCGGVVLSTEKAQHHSRSIRECSSVGEAEMARYVSHWKSVGFL